MEESWIGWQVKLKIPMLGNSSGAVGYVFNQYEDFDKATLHGLQIIFQNGKYDGFSVEEQIQYLEFVHPVLSYAGYQFENVMQVSKDFKKGYWNFEEQA